MIITSDNPYSKILGIMREEGEKKFQPSFYFGRVTKLYEVITNGITLYSDDLYINPKAEIKVGSHVLLVRMGEKFVIVCEVINP